jgi:protein-S-isoprenylcysteine O-methyltransferase Ste14
MSDLTPAAIVLLVTGSLTFGCFVWGTVRHFAREGGAPGGTRLISVLSLAGYAALVWCVLRGRISPAWPGGVALFAAAALLWAAALQSTRRAPPTLAFTDDTPRTLFDFGPYRWIRQPFYTAYMLFWVGTVLADGAAVSLILALALAVVYWRAARHEEAKFARSGLAAAYAAYAGRTGMFLPRLVPARSAGGRQAL